MSVSKPLKVEVDTIIFWVVTGLFIGVVAQQVLDREDEVVVESEISPLEISDLYEPYLEPVEPIAQEIGPMVTEECYIEKDQLDVVNFSYEYGVKYDLGYTLAAIALKESNGGRINVNIGDPSGGYYHVTLDKVLRYYRWKNTPYNLNRAMQELVNKPELAAELAVKELQSWRRNTTYNWMSTWASYHAGTGGASSTRGKEYASDIRQIIGKIKACKWTNNLVAAKSE